MSDAIEKLLERAMADVQPSAHLAQDSERGYYRHRNRRRAAVAVGAAVAISAAGALLWSAASGTDGAGVSTVVPAAPVPTTYRDVSVSCDEVDFTAQQLAQPGGAEKGMSKTSVILRQFLAHNPFEGMGTVPNTNWLLLVDTPTEVAFGHREGPVGVGQVVHMQLRNGRVVEQNVDGCSGVLVEKGHTSQPVRGAVVSGKTLDLQWANGQCGPEPAGVFDKRIARVEVHETKASVHLMLVTEPNPAAEPYLTRVNGLIACGGVGFTSYTKTKLAAPLGDRTLYDDATLNPSPITVSPPQPSLKATPPAASPSASSTPGRVVGVKTPIVLPILDIRLDPLGQPPASTASSQRLLTADRAPFQLAGRRAASDNSYANTQLLYGFFTDTGLVDYGRHYSSEKPGAALNRHSIRQAAVLIIDRGFAVSTGNPIPVTSYTAVDPITAKVLTAWIG